MVSYIEQHGVFRWAVNFLLIGCLFVLGWYWNSRAESALCTQRTYLEQQVAAGEQYQRDVIDGKREPVPGLTEADVEMSLERQRAAIRAWSNLHC